MDLNKWIWLFVVLFSLTIQQCVADDDDEGDEDGGSQDSVAPEEENGVLVLTDDNFDDAIKDQNVVLLEFYAPWCGHCKAFAAEYEKIAQTLKKDGIPVAKVDATQHKSVAGKYDVTGYPTIVILKNGEPIKYDGQRTEDAIIQRVKELSDPNWKPPPEAVITLTDSNFNEVVDNANIILVEFYAPWCGHCKKLAPEYEAAAQELKKADPPIPLAKVDATAETEVAKRFDISGYPTMKLFRKGQVYEYKGGRDKHGIVTYMQEQSSPPSVALADLKSTKNLLHQADDITIIGFFTGEDDSRLMVFQEAANNIREDFKFRHSFDESIADHLGTESGNVVVVHAERFHSKYEKSRNIFKVTDETKASDIEAFINEKSLPLVGQRNGANARKRYTKRPLVVVYYAVDFGFDYRKNTQIWREKVLEVANEMKDVTFAIASEDEFNDELQKAGLGDSSEDINVIAFDKEEKRYPMEPTDEFDSEVLSEFVTSFLAGDIKPKYKSAPAPKKNTGPVKVVVANNFDKIVMDESKDVLIEFYAPWCGHCKKLAPEYKKLGKKLKDNNDVVIAKMDAVANDVPHSKYKVEGFPTIYWAPKNSKDSPVKYEGGRELDDMLEYINKHATKTKDEL
ncbi:protein disulfide-isomerase A4-like [Styela clava]